MGLGSLKDRMGFREESGAATSHYWKRDREGDKGNGDLGKKRVVAGTRQAEWKGMLYDLTTRS